MFYILHLVIFIKMEHQLISCRTKKVGFSKLTIEFFRFYVYIIIGLCYFQFSCSVQILSNRNCEPGKITGALCYGRKSIIFTYLYFTSKGLRKTHVAIQLPKGSWYCSTLPNCNSKLSQIALEQSTYFVVNNNDLT